MTTRCALQIRRRDRAGREHALHLHCANIVTPVAGRLAGAVILSSKTMGACPVVHRVSGPIHCSADLIVATGEATDG